MKRRDFLSGLGLGGYSLVIFADELPEAAHPIPTADRVRKDLQRVAPGSLRPGAIANEPNMRLVNLECDVLVAGGGLSGVCAAIAAARHGAKVILVQDRSRLGGNSSSEVKMHVVGSSCHKGRPGWRESGLIEELHLDDAVNNPQRSFEQWDLLLYDKVVSEPNITLLFDATLYAARMNGSRIESVMVRCDLTEHLYAISAQTFLDCTGDSRLGLEAGAEFRTGRESKAEFGESLAIDRADEQTLSSSILFTSRDYGRPMPFQAPKWARKVTRKHLRHRQIDSWEYGYWWIAWGGDKNTIEDNERIRFELLSIVMGIWDYIKNSGDHPASENWAMDWVGFIPGKRESRRLVGDHLLTQHDVERGTIEDAVAIGGWPLDDHPPAGFDRPELKPTIQIRTDEVFNIPLRSLYSKNIENLMMAGRNISCTHVAFTSTRVMGTCAVVGQAAGTAAAACIRGGIDPRQIFEDKSRLRALQQTLLRDDQTIRGLVNEDPGDLARQAKLTCSDPSCESGAGLVTDGHLRDYPGKKGSEIHHWESKVQSDGVWLELAWDAPQRISEVQITFDTGFERELTLTASNPINNGIVRAPQPETVRDYTILSRAPGGDFQELKQVSGNYQRLNRHRFDPIETSAIRIHITKTNGDAMARIFEVRCYS
jgi:hypothetical protein